MSNEYPLCFFCKKIIAPETGCPMPGPQGDPIYAHYYHLGVPQPAKEQSVAEALSDLKKGESSDSDDE